MKVTFLGATHEVTGSCTLCEVGSTKFIVDCGMEQGRDSFENQVLPVNPGDVDFVLLTHAHIDHSGNLPLLYKNGFKGSVYATDATCDLCDIMLRDSAHIQMQEAEFRTRRQKRAGGEEAIPMYDMDDVEGLLKNFRPCRYGERIRPAEGVEARFTDIGHLLGSACIEIWLREAGTEKKIVFSGDVGNTNQPLLHDPSFVESADYVLIESTYGNRLHSSERPDYTGFLSEQIQRALDRGGNVVIPSFAVGRTQELLYFIREIKEKGLVHGHDGFKVYVDSPLAVEATGIFLQVDQTYFDDEARALMKKGINPLVFDGLHVSVSSEESKSINFDPEPKVIISASGMCNAGRIRHHLKHNLWRPESLVLFVGYQAEGTLGRILLEGVKNVKIFGEDIAVKAELVEMQSISGHADKNGLLSWLGGYKDKPYQVFVNHGDEDSINEFLRTLKEDRGYNAIAPFSGSVYDLAAGEFSVLTEGVPIERKEAGAPGKRKVSKAFSKLMDAVERLLEASRRSEGRPNSELSDYAARIDGIRRDMEK
ncbi:MAG: MBL fold metallo-hydrolase [Clostridia bacterium]|nr:MBL fold metallo-hydrolase [Clostridia bacterium]